MGRPANPRIAAARSARPNRQSLFHADETLSGRVVLDESSFDHCVFDRAVLVYSGGAPPRIQNCEFHAVSFEFLGAAANALALLQAMSAPSSGLLPVFKASFPKLFAH